MPRPIFVAQLWMIGLAAGCATSQPLPAPPPPPVRPATPVARQRLVIPRGALVVARLDQTVNTETSRRGGLVTATTMTPIRDADGRTVLGAGAQLIGRVAKLIEGHGVTPGQIVLVFDQLSTRAGRQRIHARVVSIDEGEEEAMPPDREPVRKGVVGGALVGGLFMGIPGALLGSGLAASGGIEKSLHKRALELRLPAGTWLSVRFDAPVAP